MLFSIITVTYNAAGVLPPTLQSIREQSCADYEFLLIDGASTDATVQLATDAQIPETRIISEPDGGLYDAMNKGIDLARGDFLIFLNAGDAFASDVVLARLAKLAAEHPAADVLYGQTQLVDAERNVIGKRHLTAPHHLTAESFSHGMLVCHQAFVARRAKVPHYNLDYRFSSDYDWCIRVLKESAETAYAGDEPLINFLTEGMTTQNHRRSLVERFRVMCRHYGTATAIVRHLSFIPRFLRKTNS